MESTLTPISIEDKEVAPADIAETAPKILKIEPTIDVWVLTLTSGKKYFTQDYEKGVVPLVDLMESKNIAMASVKKEVIAKSYWDSLTKSPFSA